MKADYKNWMPKGMILAVGGAGLGCVLLSLLFGLGGICQNRTLKVALTLVFALGALACLCGTLYMYNLYSAFSYDGKRQVSRKIIEGIAGYVKLPEGGRGLDVGCGSGALTIACGKKNPKAHFVGVDRWGKEYAPFSQDLCKNNARAEQVENVEFLKGDAIRLTFPDESFDAVTSNYVYHNINIGDRQALLLETLRVLKKGGQFAIHDIFSRSKYGDMQAFVKKLKDMGYEKVELLDTTNGLFLEKKEASSLSLQDSALLLGKK